MPASGSITLRRAALADAEEMLATLEAGFETYREFAPAGWELPAPERGGEVLRRRLPEPDTWAAIAHAGDEVAGHVGFYPAPDRRPGDDLDVDGKRPLLPGVAYLWQLFVRPGFWGAGIATMLHEAALAEMRARAYRRAHLFTPIGQARARRFYEREGWVSGDSGYDKLIALEIVEYRLVL